MKKRTFKLAVLGLMMTAVLFNCKKDDKDPSAPNEDITNALKDVKVATVTIDAPAAVVSTPSTFTTSAATAEVGNGLAAAAATGVVPASVTSAGAAVSSAISPSEVSALSSVSAATVDAVSKGGAVPADIKAVLDKARANPALAAYLPTFTFPSVGGVVVSGKRVGGTDAVEKTEKVLVDDACVAAATATFDGVKATLDASKASQDAAVLAAYNTAVSAVPPATTCTADLATRFDGYRANVNAQGTKALADIEAAKAALGSNYDLIKALTNIALLDALSSINTLQAAEAQACTQKSTAGGTNATAARDANLAKVNAAYATALAQATTLKTQAIQSCHNQGSGQ